MNLSQQVRVHSNLVHRSQPWIKLWYLAKAEDVQGSGRVEFKDFSQLCKLLNRRCSTVYQWLREGKAVGAFRNWTTRKNRLTIYLGSLTKVCLNMGIRDWGTVALMPVDHILNNLRQNATAATTQQLQQQSRTAARRCLKKKDKQIFKMPTANQLINSGNKSCDQPSRGEIHPSIIHVGKKRIFVGKTFIPVGTSQETIAGRLGCSDRTVRRHLAHLKIERRQLCQTKPAYGDILVGRRWGQSDCYAEPNIYGTWEGCELSGDERFRLCEPQGVTSYSRPGGHSIARNRLFNYRGQTWIYRCNLYLLDEHYCLKTMTRRRRSLKAQMDAQSPARDNNKFQSKDFCRERGKAGERDLDLSRSG